MRGKRFCLFVMGFVAMALCFMLGHGIGSGSAQSISEEPQLRAIYDRPANSTDSEEDTGEEPKGAPDPDAEANPGTDPGSDTEKDENVRDFGLMHAIVRCCNQI